MPSPVKRTRAVLHGGPLANAILFPPEGVAEVTLADRKGRQHLYRAGLYAPEGPPPGRPTVHLVYVGPTPAAWFDDGPPG